MSWSDVGGWLKENAGTGTALVGSLLTGNIPSAVAAGISLVSSATGKVDAKEALEALQTSPETMLKLKELYYQNEADIRKHLQMMVQLELEDKQKSHEQTQLTIRAGDVAEDKLVRWTRPLQSWFSLIATFVYIYISESPSVELVLLGLTLPWAYAGLREVGKGISAFKEVGLAKGKNK